MPMNKKNQSQGDMKMSQLTLVFYSLNWEKSERKAGCCYILKHPQLIGVL